MGSGQPHWVSPGQVWFTCTSRWIKSRCATCPAALPVRETIHRDGKELRLVHLLLFQMLSFVKLLLASLSSDFPYFSVILLGKLFSPFKNLSVSSIFSIYSAFSISLILWHSNLYWWLESCKRISTPNWNHVNYPTCRVFLTFSLMSYLTCLALNPQKMLAFLEEKCVSFQ